MVLQITLSDEQQDIIDSLNNNNLIGKKIAGLKKL